eukprot:6490440-Amphidinium_carterae.2
MAGMIDSEVAFGARARELNVSEVVLTKLKGRGWHTYGGLAFSTAFAPGANDYEHFRTEVLPYLVDNEDDPEATSIRRLWYESQVIASAELKRLTTIPSEVGARKLNAAERGERLQRIRNKLNCLIIEDGTEPSHHLVDTFVSMYEAGVVSFLSWDFYTARAQEMRGERTDSTPTRVWKADSSGVIRESAGSAPLIRAPVNSDLLMQQALFRRGIALDMADLLDFNIHQRLVHRYLHDLMQDPIPGYSRVSWAQIKRCDEEIWRRMADLTQGSLKRDCDGRRPLDKVAEKMLDDPRVFYLLLPLPVASGSSSLSQAPSSKRQFSQSKSSTSAPQKYQKGSGKGKNKDRGPPAPAALRGYNLQLADGRRICY